MAQRPPFSLQTSKAEQTQAARRDLWATPLALRTRLPLSEAERDEVRRRLGQQLDNFAVHVDRVSVRFEDANGPRGGVDAVCRVKVGLRALPSVVVEERAANALTALGRAAKVAARAVGRTLRRAGWSVRGAKGGRRGTPLAAARGRDDEGSLIGRRVGRGKENLRRVLARPEKQRRDVYVDTSLPGVSASDRRVGYGATATRNTKLNTAGMAATLEDSRTTPSRKSTRKSKNRTKAATLLERKAQLQLLSPSARARRGR